MDIMMLLEGGALTAVYDDFRKKLVESGDGLSMTEFVKSMFANIPGVERMNKGARCWCAHVPWDGSYAPCRQRSPHTRSVCLRRLWLQRRVASVKLVKDLCELFEQIDVNGDGALEWEEFTGFCVEAGMVASRRAVSIAPFKVCCTSP